MFSAISPEIRQRIRAIAFEAKPQECCGFIVSTAAGAIVVPSRNMAANPEEDFKTSPAAWRRAERAGKVMAIYHSHWQDSQPPRLTFADIAQAKAKDIPYYLVHVEGGEDYYDPSSLDPFPMRGGDGDPRSIEFYLGRLYSWWRSDCYTLLRDYYRGVLGIVLPDFERSPDEDEWQKQGWNRYVNDLASIGFHQVEGEPQMDDLILMTLEGSNPHHIGIMVEPMRRQFIHHLRYRLSEKSVYGGYWQDRTHSIWRYHADNN